MGKHILLGVTGSIAAYKACEIIGALRKKGFSVRCAMTPDAEHFIAPLTFETLTGQKTAHGMFRLPDNREPLHVSLADEADVILVAPATADCICKVASGICDDILTCTICASSKPVIFAPAMNDNMFKNPIVQDKIAYLRGKGYHFVDPVEGHLACGRDGIGHLAPLDRIIEETEKVLKNTGR